MDVGHGLFAPGSRVLDAQRVLSREHPVDAIGGAHTLADVLGPALHDLLHDIGIGHVAAGHGDHVDMAVGDRAGRRLGAEIALAWNTTIPVSARTALAR